MPTLNSKELLFFNCKFLQFMVSKNRKGASKIEFWLTVFFENVGKVGTINMTSNGLDDGRNECPTV